MKTKIFKFLVALGVVTGFTGCDFLDEESYGSTTEIFKEENGIQALVNQSYTKINNLYGGDSQWFYLTEQGTDLWLRGGNNSDTQACDYNGLNATSSTVAWLWNHCYKGMANINMFFETIDDTPFAKEEDKNICKAEMLTMRSMFLWIITETWGDSYLPMSTDETEGMEARRSPRADFYREIISGLEEALELLPDTRTKIYGKIDAPTVKAFLSRMYLYDEQFDKAEQLASEVIDGSYGYELSPSLKDLWDDSKRNDEFIWTTEFVEDSGFRQSSWVWRMHAMFIDRYPGLQTMLHYTGYGSCISMPSLYYINLFNHDADLRWQDLHQTVWLYNDAGDDTSMFPEMQELYVDTAFYLSVKPFTPADRQRMKTRYTAFDLTDMYDEQGVPTDRKTFIGMTKFYDHTRPGDVSTISDRNYPVIRLGELYLIRAEAKLRGANHDVKGALKDITELRKRCIKPGYEEQMALTEEDMTLDFILDERARELGAEWQRWLDLKRLGKLMDHVRAYNPDASEFLKDYHLLRPIPQVQFDGMPDWTTLGQNSGY